MTLEQHLRIERLLRLKRRLDSGWSLTHEARMAEFFGAPPPPIRSFGPVTVVPLSSDGAEAAQLIADVIAGHAAKKH